MKLMPEVIQLLKVAFFLMFLGFIGFMYEYLKSRANKKWSNKKNEITIDVRDYTPESLDNPEVQKALIQMIKKELEDSESKE